MCEFSQRVDAIDQGIAVAISRELHKTAQPLTALQGLLELSLQREQTVQQYRGSVEKAIQQLQRVTDCFGQIRRLALEQPPGEGNNHRLA